MNDPDPPKPAETKEASESPPAPETVELAEIAAAHDSFEQESFYPRSPKLKDYLTSADAPSRYLMVLSIIFGILAIVSVGLLVMEYVKYRHIEQKAVSSASETIKIEPTFHASIGQFKVIWDDSEMTASLFVECTTHEACDDLKNRFEQTHDLLLPILQGSTREAVLNPGRKLRLRQELAEKLNDLKLKGQVIEVDFSDLTIEARK